MHGSDVLNDPNLVATVFAPTNDAFVALEKSLGYTQEQLLNSAILKPTLLYHVVPKVAAQVCQLIVLTSFSPCLAVYACNHATIRSCLSSRQNIFCSESLQSRPPSLLECWNSLDDRVLG